jgi:hypothetical protein
MLTYIDNLTESFQNRIVNVITVPVLYSPVNPTIIPETCCGIFLGADEIGVWLLSKSKDRPGLKEIFYHDKIVKVEEVDSFRISELPDNERKIVEAFYNREEVDPETLPDVPDPSDTGKISEMLNKVKQMVTEKKDKNDFLA